MDDLCDNCAGVHRDHGRTDILCPREISHIRRSWVDHQRYTAILVRSSMLLTVYMPHSGHDDEDYIATLEAVRSIMNEGKKMEAVDVYIRETLTSS